MHLNKSLQRIAYIGTAILVVTCLLYAWGTYWLFPGSLTFLPDRIEVYKFFLLVSLVFYMIVLSLTTSLSSKLLVNTLVNQVGDQEALQYLVAMKPKEKYSLFSFSSYKDILSLAKKTSETYYKRLMYKFFTEEKLKNYDYSVQKMLVVLWLGFVFIIDPFFTVFLAGYSSYFPLVILFVLIIAPVVYFFLVQHDIKKLTHLLAKMNIPLTK